MPDAPGVGGNYVGIFDPDKYGTGARRRDTRWRVRFIDEGRYDFEFRGDASLYRYWDASMAAEFSLRMAQQALEVDLHQETRYLAKYDVLKRAVETRYDVQNNTLATLIHSALQNGNVVSRNRRKQFAGQVDEGVFELIEVVARDMDAANALPDDEGWTASGTKRRRVSRPRR